MMKDHSPSRTHFSSVMQNVGLNQIQRLHNDYRGIINGEYDHVPDRIFRIIEEGNENGHMRASYMVGAMAVESAAKLTIMPDEQVDLLAKASDSWRSIITASERFSSPNIYTLQAKLGLATLPAEMSLALTDKLPAECFQQEMFDNLLELASFSKEYSRYIYENPNTSDRVKRNAFSELSGFNSELAVLLIHQRFSLNARTLGQLALPAYYSEDHGMIAGRGSSKSHAWDINLYEEDEDGVDVLAKIQVKSRASALRKHRKNYASDILTICVAEDLARHDQVKDFKATWVLNDIENEYNGQRVDQITPMINRRMNKSSSRLEVMTDKLLNVIEDHLD